MESFLRRGWCGGRASDDSQAWAAYVAAGCGVGSHDGASGRLGVSALEGPPVSQLSRPGGELLEEKPVGRPSRKESPRGHRG